MFISFASLKKVRHKYHPSYWQTKQYQKGFRPFLHNGSHTILRDTGFLVTNADCRLGVLKYYNLNICLTISSADDTKKGDTINIQSTFTQSYIYLNVSWFLLKFYSAVCKIRHILLKGWLLIFLVESQMWTPVDSTTAPAE